MDGLVNCPKCGKPRSASDIGFCMECERKYQQERAEEQDAERAQLLREINGCKCEEGCSYCARRRARLYEMDGRYDMAAAVMNP